MRGVIFFYNTFSCSWHMMTLYFLRMMTVVMVTNTVSMGTVGDLIICACAFSSSGTLSYLSTITNKSIKVVNKFKNHSKCNLKHTFFFTKARWSTIKFWIFSLKTAMLIGFTYMSFYNNLLTIISSLRIIFKTLL